MISSNKITDLYRPTWVQNKNPTKVKKALNSLGIETPNIQTDQKIVVSELDIETAILNNANSHGIEPSELESKYAQLLKNFRRKGFQIFCLDFSTLPVHGTNTNKFIEVLGIRISQELKDAVLASIWVPKITESTKPNEAQKKRKFQVLSLGKNINQSETPTLLEIHEIELPENSIWLTDIIYLRNREWLIKHGIIKPDEYLERFDVAKLLHSFKFQGVEGIEKFFNFINQVHQRFNRIKNKPMPELGIPFYRLVYKLPNDQYPRIGTLHLRKDQNGFKLNMNIGTIIFNTEEDLEEFKNSLNSEFDINFIRTKKEKKQINGFQQGKYNIIVSLTIEQFIKLLNDAENALKQDSDQIPIGQHGLQGAEYLILDFLGEIIIDDGFEYDFIKYLQLMATRYYQTTRRKAQRANPITKTQKQFKNNPDNNENKNFRKICRHFRKPAIPPLIRSIFGCNMYSPVKYKKLK